MLRGSTETRIGIGAIVLVTGTSTVITATHSGIAEYAANADPDPF